MLKIFEQGSFNSYSNVDLKNARSQILKHSLYGVSRNITVFISHKHDDLNDLKGVLGFLEKCYSVTVYIDSQDPTMPKVTSKETALNIKNRIKQCDKFILLATNKAIESKWCNWELGFGDAHKFKDNIALFPMKPKGTNYNEYKGSEYLNIYPYITQCIGNEIDKTGKPLVQGLYVKSHDENGNSFIPLQDWFNK